MHFVLIIHKCTCPLTGRRTQDTNFTFHRGEVQGVFLDNLHPTRPVLVGKRLVSYEQPPSGLGPIVLRFQDGTTATCDVLVGCDGIKSAVRRTMYSRLAEEAEVGGHAEEAARLLAMNEPIWSGCVAYRGLIPAAKLEENVRKEALVPQIVSPVA